MIAHITRGVLPDDPRVLMLIDRARSYGLRPVIEQPEGTHEKPLMVYLKDGETVRASSIHEDVFEMDGVEHVQRVSASQVTVERNGGERHVIQIGKSSVGPGHPTLLIAGPCSIDKHTPATVELLAKRGVKHVRGCFRKPRSRPEAFRGFGVQALTELLHAARDNGVESIWTEVIESCDIDEVRKARDNAQYSGKMVVWVGARNLGNYRLLEKLGQQREFVVMLKHGLHMTKVDELLDIAGFVLAGPMYWDSSGNIDEKRSAHSGNRNLLFCVRGLQKRDQYDQHRYYPNFGWIDALHERSWAPAVLDPSHSGGRVDLVYQDLVNGLEHHPDAVLIETHIKPSEALSDKDQAIPTSEIGRVIDIVTRHNELHCKRQKAV